MRLLVALTLLLSNFEEKTDCFAVYNRLNYLTITLL